jgi:hypothetical protein
MGTQENGIPANISGNLPAPVAIASSTAANPTQITTSSNHGRTTGDVVDISGHGPNFGANGQYAVTVTGLTTFTIPVDTSAGTPGTTSGNVQALALGPTFLVPADGVDNEDAASVNVPFDALADRTAFVGSVTGAHKLAARTGVFRTDDTGSSWATVAFGGLDNTWTATSGSFSTLSPAPTVNVGDAVDIEVDVNVVMNGGGTTGFAQVMLGLFNRMLHADGTTATAFLRIDGSLRVVSFNQDVGSGTNTVSCRLSGTILAGTGVWPVESSLGLRLLLQAQTSNHLIVPSLSLIGDYKVSVRQWRPTSMPQ